MIECHKCVYGKLASERSGRVVGMVPPRVTSHSEGFPLSVLESCDPLRIVTANGRSCESAIHQSARGRGGFFFQPVVDAATGLRYMSATRFRQRPEMGEGADGASYPQFTVYLIDERDWIEQGALLTLTLEHWLDTEPDRLRDYRNDSIRPKESLDIDHLASQQELLPLKRLPEMGSPPWGLLDTLESPFAPRCFTLNDRLTDEADFALRLTFVVAMLPPSLRLLLSFCGNFEQALVDFDFQYLPVASEEKVALKSGRDGALSGIAGRLSLAEMGEWETAVEKKIEGLHLSASLSSWKNRLESRAVRHEVLEALSRSRAVEALDLYLSGVKDDAPPYPENLRVRIFWCERLHETLQVLLGCSKEARRGESLFCYKDAGGEWKAGELELLGADGGVGERLIPARVLSVAASLVDDAGDWGKAWGLLLERMSTDRDRAAVMRWTALRGTLSGDQSQEGVRIGEILDYAELKRIYCLVDGFVGFSGADEGSFTSAPSWRSAFFQRLDRLYENTPRLLVVNPYNLVSAAALPLVAVRRGLAGSMREMGLISMIADLILKSTQQEVAGTLAMRRIESLYQSVAVLLEELGRDAPIDGPDAATDELVQTCVERAIKALAHPAGCGFWRRGGVAAARSSRVTSASAEAAILLLVKGCETLGGVSDEIGMDIHPRFHLLCGSVLQALHQSCHPLDLAAAILRACTEIDSACLLGESGVETPKGRLIGLLTLYLRKVLQQERQDSDDGSNKRLLGFADALYFYLQDYLKSQKRERDTQDDGCEIGVVEDSCSFELALGLGLFVLERFLHRGGDYKGEFLRIFQYIEPNFLARLECNEKEPSPWIVSYAEVLKKGLGAWARTENPWLDPIQDLREEVVRNYLMNRLGWPLCQYYGRLGDGAGRGTNTEYRELAASDEKLLVVRGALEEWKIRHGRDPRDLLGGGAICREPQNGVNRWVLESLRDFIRVNDDAIDALLGDKIVYLFGVVDLIKVDGDSRRWIDHWSRAPSRIKEALLAPLDHKVWELGLVIEATRNRLGFCRSLADLLFADSDLIEERLFGRILGFATFEGGVATLIDRYDEEIIARLETYLLILRLMESNLQAWRNLNSEIDLSRLALPGALHEAVAEVGARSGEARYLKAYDQLRKGQCVMRTGKGVNGLSEGVV